LLDLPTNLRSLQGKSGVEELAGYVELNSETQIQRKGEKRWEWD